MSAGKKNGLTWRIRHNLREKWKQSSAILFVPPATINTGPTCCHTGTIQKASRNMLNGERSWSKSRTHPSASFVCFLLPGYLSALVFALLLSLFFASLVFLFSGGVRMLVFFPLISVLHPSRSVRACNLRKKCAFSSVFPFLISCFLLLPCLTWYFSSLDSNLDGFVIFSILISISDVELFFSSCLFFVFWVICGLLGCCGDVNSVPHVMYLIRTCVDLPSYFFVWGVSVLQLSWVLLFARYIFSPSEVLLPLHSYWRLSCDHGLQCIVAMR